MTSTRNVALGGLGYGDATFDGKLRGKPLSERLATAARRVPAEHAAGHRGAGDDPPGA